MKRINNKGITLIALIITIIVMLILAVVVLNVVVGKNGLIKLSIETAKKSNEEAAKEKLQIELENLRIRKYADEAYNEQEYIDNHLKSKGMSVSSNIVIVDGIAFEIDRENLVILNCIKEFKQAYVKITSKIKERVGNGIVNILVKIESDTAIDTITFPNEDGTSSILTTDELIFEKDLKANINKEYIVIVKTKDGKITTRAILIDGDGTKEHPYIIRTKEELQEVNENLSAYYKLGDDIDLKGFDFTPIGTKTTPFKGNIDGTGYTISNLNINNEENDNIGLFGYSNGVITNITLKNITVKGKSSVGGLVGYNTGTITNCAVSGDVTGTGDNVGGLIGYLYVSNKNMALSGNRAEVKVSGVNQVGGLIGYSYIYVSKQSTAYALKLEKSYATGDVEGVSNVGGLVGHQYAYGYEAMNTRARTYIQQCYATGNVIGSKNNIGGLVGYARAYGNAQTRWNGKYHQDAYVIIENSFSTGKMEGTSNVGGLIGYALRQSKNEYTATKGYIQITNTYAIGEVIATGKAGGLVGAASGSGYGSTTVKDSYWAPETTKQENGVLGNKNTISYMLYKVGYPTTWNFDEIWEINEGRTIAYLKNTQKPNSVDKTNIKFEEFKTEGEGTEENPFIIKVPIQLQKINDKLDVYYKLGANINLANYEFTPIGTSTNPFTGNIDGAGYIISNLNYDNEAGENVGLFGYNSGVISNIVLENVTVKGKTNVGGLIGYNAGTVTNCTVNGNITGIGDNTGGLAGYNTGTVTNCIANENITIKGKSNVGGLVGYNTGTVTNCIVSGNVIGTGDNVGGLIGYVYASNKNMTLSENRAEVKVTGANQVGGLIGYSYIYASKQSTAYTLKLEKSYATGDVEGVSNVGGLVGHQYGYAYEAMNTRARTYIQQCYATGNVIGSKNNIGGLVGYAHAQGNAQTRWNGQYYQDAYIIMENSFSTGKVEGTSNVGGLIGYALRQSKNEYTATKGYIQITNTYAIGEVIATGQAGGLVGTASGTGYGSTTVTDSFWNTETTKQETSVLGTSANTDGMTGTELYANWSSDIWTIEQGKYPTLNF